jgi:hypothetical protein
MSNDSGVMGHITDLSLSSASFSSKRCKGTPDNISHTHQDLADCKNGVLKSEGGIKQKKQQSKI